MPVYRTAFVIKAFFVYTSLHCSFIMFHGLNTVKSHDHVSKNSLSSKIMHVGMEVIFVK